LDPSNFCATSSQDPILGGEIFNLQQQSLIDQPGHAAGFAT
jgi:hypothetical protein